MITREDDGGRPLLTFHGPVRITEQAAADGARQYVVTPLADAAVLEALCEVRVREAWYAGVDAALREAERLAIYDHPLTLVRVRAAFGALRHVKDRRDE